MKCYNFCSPWKTNNAIYEYINDPIVAKIISSNINNEGEFGADCNVRKNDGNTFLLLATEKKLDIHICSLLSHGANPNIINKTNLKIPLHIGIINKIMNMY